MTNYKLGILFAGAVLSLGLLSACSDDVFDEEGLKDNIEDTNDNGSTGEKEDDAFKGEKDSLGAGDALTDANKYGELATDWVREEIGSMEYEDGDTFYYYNADDVRESVRLLLIDAPESYDDLLKEGQDYSAESHGKLANTLDNAEKIELEYPADDALARDKYGRLLAYVWADGVNVNELLVREGYARKAYVYEPTAKYLDEIEAAELEAKENKLNIWSIEDYVTDKGFDVTVTERYAQYLKNMGQ